MVPKEFGPKIGMLRKYCNIPVRIRPLEIFNAIRNPIMKDGLETLDPIKVQELGVAEDLLSAALMFGVAAIPEEIRAMAAKKHGIKIN